MNNNVVKRIVSLGINNIVSSCSRCLIDGSFNSIIGGGESGFLIVKGNNNNIKIETDRFYVCYLESKDKNIVLKGGVKIAVITVFSLVKILFNFFEVRRKFWRS